MTYALADMFRYITLLWNPTVPRQHAAAQRVACVLRERRWHEADGVAGLRVFHRDAQRPQHDARRLPDSEVFVLGVLFERHGDELEEAPARRWTASTAQAQAVGTSRGRWLIEHCWGDYVAVGRDPHTQETWVLKDPSGELPALVTTLDGATIVFSCIADLVETGLFRFEVRPGYLARRLLFGGLEAQGAFANVSQVHRGECVRMGHGIEIGDGERAREHREFFWHPAHFAQNRDPIDDPMQAAMALRAKVRSCTHSWAELHERILHRLSGGLDSSIIAGTLRDVPGRPRVTCYTYYHPGGPSDERPWASLAAEHAGLEHLEWPVRPEDIPLEMSDAMPLAIEPVPVMGYLLRSTIEASIAATREASAVCCGDGGDSGFGGEAFAHALPDYLRRHGPTNEAWRLATQIAVLTEQSSWRVFTRAVRRVVCGSGMEHLAKTLQHASRLLSPQLREAYACERRYPHPWFSDRKRVPWGLIRRLGTLLAMPRFYDVAPGAPQTQVIAPLYAQPVIELLLRIPLYRHFENGRERGLARRAFAQDIPAPIAQRAWKDRAPRFYDALVFHQRAFLREALLDGFLAREGLLDRAMLERALSDQLVRHPILPGEIFRHLEVELWARQWRRVQPGGRQWSAGTASSHDARESEPPTRAARQSAH